jgi:hypothetical protein
MSKKTIGWLLVVGGVVISVISLSADYLGMGQQLGIIGWKQQSVAAIGLVVLLIGVWLLFKNSKKTS